MIGKGVCFGGKGSFIAVVACLIVVVVVGEDMRGGGKTAAFHCFGSHIQQVLCVCTIHTIHPP